MKSLAVPALLCISMFSCQSAPPPKKAAFGPSNPQRTTVDGVAYYASVIELIPEKEGLYRELHADVWPEVVAAIEKANIRDYRIYRASLDGKTYLFSTFAYVGNDFETDMASIGTDPTTRDRWWPITDACQQRIPGTPDGEQWMGLEQLMRLP
ncbi:MAG: L-rhamnose mutarotase [Planctomycetota bacterium]|jgi:L-rhamnose mutarotase|nr:L-rhamnose mutarotase [Planctomycetota bacterium]